MRHALLIIVFAIFAGLSGYGQTAESLTFEVASVKPTPPPEPGARLFFGPPRGGPGSNSPGQITWTNAALRSIIMTAYDVQTFQLTAPDWLATERYDVIAKVPAGATKNQVNMMWQSLLKDRFGLVLHHESKEFQVDILTVAKGGLKMKATDLGPDPEPFTPVPGPPKLDKNGVREMNGFGSIVTIFPDGPRASMLAKGLTPADLAARLGGLLRRPVIDRTGLTGRYDFTLGFTPDLTGFPLPPPPPGPNPADSASSPSSDVSSAVEKQLGLKLTGSKEKLDVIVVDRAEKVPTEN